VALCVPFRNRNETAAARVSRLRAQRPLPVPKGRAAARRVRDVPSGGESSALV